MDAEVPEGGRPMESLRIPPVPPFYWPCPERGLLAYVSVSTFPVAVSGSIHRLLSKELLGVLQRVCK